MLIHFTPSNVIVSIYLVFWHTVRAMGHQPTLIFGTNGGGEPMTEVVKSTNDMTMILSLEISVAYKLTDKASMTMSTEKEFVKINCIIKIIQANEKSVCGCVN